MNDNQNTLFAEERPIDKMANRFIEWLNRRNGNPRFPGKVKVLYHTEPSWNDLWNIHENIAKIAPDGMTRSTWETLNAYTIFPFVTNSQGKKRLLKPKARLAFLRRMYPGYKELLVKSLARYDAVIHLRSANLKNDDPGSTLAAVGNQCVKAVQEWNNKSFAPASTSDQDDRQTTELLVEFMKTVEFPSL